MATIFRAYQVGWAGSGVLCLPASQEIVARHEQVGDGAGDEHVAEAAHRDFVWHRLTPEINPSEGAPRLRIVERLEIGRALATDPKLIMLDEVMAGLNATEVDEVLDAIRQIKSRALTVLIVEHVIQSVMRLSDRVVVLHHGELIAIGAPKAVVEDERVIETYLGRAP